MLKYKPDMDKLTRDSLIKWREKNSRGAADHTRMGKKLFHWGDRTFVMGIVNVSPDSFSGDGLKNLDQAVEQAYRFIEEGVDIIDIGGESTRPGASPMDAETELKRVLPVVQELAGKIEVPISVDTYRPLVAEKVLAAGANAINDVWALKHDPSLAKVAAEYGVPIILMSSQRDRPVTHILREVILDIKRAMDICLAAGITWENIIVDPGIGFGKKLEQNYELIRRLGELKILGRPILLGVSRKSVIGMTLDLPEDQRLEGTSALDTLGIENGADIIRVHDVRKQVRIARMTDAIVRKKKV
jgi:dihydropteroate synthase